MSSLGSSKKNKAVTPVSKMAPLTFNGLILTAYLVAAALLALQAGVGGRDSLVECQEQLTVESRQLKDNDDLTKTIEYLERLDQYFTKARPRFGRSEYKQFRFGTQPSLVGSSGEVNSLRGGYRSLIDLVNSRLARKYKDLESI